MVRSGVTQEQVGQWFWCTITAPGADSLPWDPDVCTHAPDVACSGAKGCRVTEFDAAVWNGSAPRRWSWFMTYVRRRLGEQVQYVGVWEYQERGVLHRHFLVRVERPTTRKRVMAAVRGASRAWGFGSQIDVQSITGDAARQAWYVAKYAGKTVDSIDGRRVLEPRTGELRAARGFRPWSASRAWGETMASVRVRQRAWSRQGGGGAKPGAPGGGAADALDPNSDISTLDTSSGSPAPSVSVVPVLL